MFFVRMVIVLTSYLGGRGRGIKIQTLNYTDRLYFPLVLRFTISVKDSNQDFKIQTRVEFKQHDLNTTT